MSNNNTGDRNTGNCNTGNWNTGNRNTGNCNTGNCNTGNCNTGDRNTGNCNTGNCNTGDRNTGNWNTGNRNTGNCNTGDRNTGDWNTGDWNTVDHETGYFNTITSEMINIFNKPCKRIDWEEAEKPHFLYFPLTEWVTSSEMTEEEKTANPESEVTGGYLKKYEYKEAFQKAYNKSSKEDKELLLKLPNFDAEVFLEISGIDVRETPEQKELEEIRKEMEVLTARMKELESKQK